MEGLFVAWNFVHISLTKFVWFSVESLLMVTHGGMKFDEKKSGVIFRKVWKHVDYINIKQI